MKQVLPALLALIAALSLAYAVIIGSSLRGYKSLGRYN